MEIRKSAFSDIDSILKLFAQAREFMKTHGNPNQWGKNYPEISLIKQDITNGNSYICVEDGEIIGTFFYAKDIEPTYAHIYEGEWQNNKPYGVVHRIASVKGKRGVATFCLDWCFNQCKNIRIDTHKENIPMQNLLKKNGYVSCGIIYLENGDERIGFQKTDTDIESSVFVQAGIKQGENR